jgi:hypothetical protein
MGAEVSHVDGRPDRQDELIVAVRKLANVPKTAKELRQIRIFNFNTKQEIMSGKPVAAYKHNTWITRDPC